MNARDFSSPFFPWCLFIQGKIIPPVRTNIIKCI